MIPNSHRLPRVCAVSYLNTVPLVWGMLHGPQQGLVDLSFELPSVCADKVRAGEADIGILPVIEMHRQGLEMFPGTGIIARGPVRSILLISQVPFHQIRTLAADSGSRTSVMLARVFLARRHGVDPEIRTRKAGLEAMLAECDAALIIGDPALRIDPAALPCHVADLGEEWTNLTGLPMVFAVWSGRPGVVTPELTAMFADSCAYGLERIEEIAAREHAARGISRELAHEYLTRYIQFSMSERDYAGMQMYLQYATALDSIEQFSS